MARRRNAFGFRRGGARRSGKPRWTAVAFADTGVAGTVDFIELVAPSDYATATALEDSGVLVRIRGNLQLYNTSATLACTYGVAIYAADDGAAALDPTSQAQLQAGNILWTRNGVLAPMAAASNAAAHFMFEDIDIKSKRKLEEPQNSIWLSIVSLAGGGAIAYGGVMRSLLRLNA